jgi:hypothetical protein
MRAACMTHDPTIADDVLGYLLRYPEAQDTVEGIAEWWLAEQHAMRTLTAVRRAVADLEARGFVVRTSLAGAQQPPRFQLNPAREQEIRKYFASRNT